MEHLRRYSCFSGRSVRHETSCSISSKPSFQAFAIPVRNLSLLNLDYHLPKPWTDCLCAKSCIRLHLCVLRHELQVTLGPTHPETEVKHLHRETWTCVDKKRCDANQIKKKIKKGPQLDLNYSGRLNSSTHVSIPRPVETLTSFVKSKTFTSPRKTCVTNKMQDKWQNIAQYKGLSVWMSLWLFTKGDKIVQLMFRSWE